MEVARSLRHRLQASFTIILFLADYAVSCFTHDIFRVLIIPCGFATLRCAEHDSCPVRFRVVVENVPSRLRVFRNNKNHSSIARSSEGSRFTYTRLPDGTRQEIVNSYKHDPRLLPSFIYNTHLAPPPTSQPTPESPSKREERRKLKRLSLQRLR